MNKEMRYKILTFLIMVLNKWRYSVVSDWRIVKKSPLVKDTIPFKELAEDYGVIIECCDCGLKHRFFKEGEELKLQPLRPVDYDYSWRLK